MPDSESDEERRTYQCLLDRVFSMNGRTELGIVFGIRHLGQLSKGCRDLDFGHQEQPSGWNRVRFTVERRRFQVMPTTRCRIVWNVSFFFVLAPSVIVLVVEAT